MAQANGPSAATFVEGQVEADGFQVRYREAGQGDTVVMLEGISWGLSRLQDALAQQYRVVALELPGFGASEANTRSQSVKDLANTVARAAAQVAGSRYTLIGSSFGADVALWQALQAPDDLDALILISPTAIRPLGGPPEGATEQTARRLLAHPENARDLPQVDPAVLAREQALAQRLGGAPHNAEAESRLHEIQCATLVVFGLQDRMAATEAASVYREKIPNCNVSLVYDAGHLIVAERPEALISLVADYVERRETFIVGHQSSVINP